MLLSSSQIFTSCKRKMSPRIWHWILSLYSHQAMRKMSSQIWHWILSLHPFFFLDFPLAPFSLLWRILNLLFIIIHYFPPAPFSSICRILNLLKWAVLLHISEVIRYCFTVKQGSKRRSEIKCKQGRRVFSYMLDINSLKTFSIMFLSTHTSLHFLYQVFALIRRDPWI